MCCNGSPFTSLATGGNSSSFPFIRSSNSAQWQRYEFEFSAWRVRVAFSCCTIQVGACFLAHARRVEQLLARAAHVLEAHNRADTMDRLGRVVERVHVELSMPTRVTNEAKKGGRHAGGRAVVVFGVIAWAGRRAGGERWLAAASLAARWGDA